MSQQFEFGDWVQVGYYERDDEDESSIEWRDARYLYRDPKDAFSLPHFVFLVDDPDSDCFKDELVRPHPTKKREAFATLSVTHNAPIVPTGIALEYAKQFIELAIKANNGGLNG